MNELLQHLRERRAALAAEEANAANHLYAIKGGIAELDLLLDQLTPRVEIKLIDADGEEPQGNQQYDLSTLNGSAAE